MYRRSHIRSGDGLYIAEGACTVRVSARDAPFLISKKPRSAPTRVSLRFASTSSTAVSKTRVALAACSATTACARHAAHSPRTLAKLARSPTVASSRRLTPDLRVLSSMSSALTLVLPCSLCSQWGAVRTGRWWWGCGKAFMMAIAWGWMLVW